MFRFPLILIISILVLASCKKEKPFMLEISSSVVSHSGGAKVAGAKVVLYVQEINNNGIYSAALNKKGETVTDANGDFTFKFEQGDAINYRIEITKEQYFHTFLELNSKTLKPDSPYTSEIKIMPEAYVKINMKNTNFHNANDHFSISTFISNAECDCCKNASYSFKGATDTSFTCMLYGPKEYKFIWSVKRDNHDNVSQKIETFFCNALDTTVFELEY